MVMATAALRCIRQAFPDASISAVARSWLCPILEHSPRLDEVIPYDLKGRHAGWGGHWSLTQELKRRRFDLAMVLPHSFRTAWTAALAGVRRRVGYDRGDRGWVLTDSLRPPGEGLLGWRPVPKTLYYLDLCRAAGLAVDSTRLELFAGEEDKRVVQDLLAEHGIASDDRLVLLNPGANFGSSKCWPAERFAEVADMLVERCGVRAALICGPGEEPIVEAILTAARRRPANLAARRLALGSLKALVERCDLMVTNDTGPRHFAVAFDKPTVVIMGSTDPRHTASNLDKTIVLSSSVACGPCYKRVCPTDHVCMRNITAEAVVAAAEQLMATHWH